MAILDKFKKAWNAFQSYEEQSFDYNLGPTSTYRPDRTRHLFYNDRSIITAIYTRIAIDVANIKIKHVVVDEFGRFSKDSKSIGKFSASFLKGTIIEKVVFGSDN